MELVFIRHGQSQWNAKNLFTGWRDVNLSEQGVAEATAAGACGVESGEGLKNLFELVGSDAGPLVFDPHVPIGALADPGECHCAVLR